MTDLSETYEDIRYWHRQRVFSMEQRKRANLSLGSFLRTQLGWQLDLDEKERRRIADQALALIKMGEQDAKGTLEVDEPAYIEWQSIISASIMAREPFDMVETRATKEMKALASSLPVWEEFGQDILGFGALSLAIIVAEAGDLSNYPTWSHLWKRMGVAVIDGKAQGRPGKGASAEDWIRHGYNPARRSRLYTIGDALIKSNKTGRYRTMYLERKEFELARNPEMTKGHAHRRAQRFMEKRLLRDLWCKWTGYESVPIAA